MFRVITVWLLGPMAMQLICCDDGMPFMAGTGIRGRAFTSVRGFVEAKSEL